MEKLVIIDLKGRSSRSLFSPQNPKNLISLKKLISKIEAGNKISCYSVDRVEYLNLLKNFDQDTVVYIFNY